MELARWTGTVQDAAGNAIAGASITVRRESDNALVQVYGDRAGEDALGNPFTADEATVHFHVAGGSYRIKATHGAFEREWRYVAIGTAAEKDTEHFAGIDDVVLLTAQELVAEVQGQARANIGIADAVGYVDMLINGMGQVNQATYTTVVDDNYWCDQHYVLTQTASVTPTIITDVANGLPTMMRLTQSQAIAQRMGNAQILEASVARGLRGRKVTLGGKLRCSSNQNIRFAVLEWTGTADAVTSDIVNNWAGTPVAGSFFLGSNLVVAAVGMLQVPNTITDFDLVADISGACNNLIVMVWSDGTAAQSVTLDMVWSLLPGDWTASSWPFVRPRHVQQEMALCDWYYEEKSFLAGSYAATAQAISTTSAGWGLEYARKRVAPAISLPTDLKLSQANGTLVTTSHTAGFASPTNARVVSTATGLVAGNASRVYADADCKIIINARL